MGASSVRPLVRFTAPAGPVRAIHALSKLGPGWVRGWVRVHEFRTTALMYPRRAGPASVSDTGARGPRHCFRLGTATGRSVARRR